MVLIVISALLLLIRLVYPYFLGEEPLLIENLPALPKAPEPAKNLASAPSEVFAFDPNKVSYQQLLSLGFPEKTAKTLLRFRQKGFVFRNKSDLQKVYGVPPDLYKRLQKYILIEASGDPQDSSIQKKRPDKKPASSQPQQIRKIELNSADSTALLEIKGIGPVFAKRILKYRELLGGFYELEQLKEVYGMNDEAFQRIHSQVSVDSRLLRQIQLNSADFKSINRHPYLSYESSLALVKLRRKKQLKEEDLQTILNDLSLYHKLLPYIRFD